MMEEQKLRQKGVQASETIQPNKEILKIRNITRFHNSNIVMPLSENVTQHPPCVEVGGRDVKQLLAKYQGVPYYFILLFSTLFIVSSRCKENGFNFATVLYQTVLMNQTRIKKQITLCTKQNKRSSEDVFQWTKMHSKS